MANGEAATAAGMDTVPSTAKRQLGYDEINKTRDYIAGKTGNIGEAIPIAKGGTGGTTAANARASLAAANVPTATQSDVDGDPYRLVAANNSTGELRRVTGAIGDGYIPTELGGNRFIGGALTAGGDVFSGRDVIADRHLWTNGATAATSNFVVLYHNGDGRVCRGSSSRRYKKSIRNARRVSGSVLAVPLREFQMRGADDGVYHVGHIAEELADNDATARFVVLDADGQPDAYDEIAWLKAAVYELHARVAELEAGQA